MHCEAKDEKCWKGAKSCRQNDYRICNFIVTMKKKLPMYLVISAKFNLYYEHQWVYVLNVIMRHSAPTRALYRRTCLVFNALQQIGAWGKFGPLVFWDLNVPEKQSLQKINASHNTFFLTNSFCKFWESSFLSWYFLTYCAIIATQCVSCALFWRDFSNALKAGQLPSSKSIKRLWCEQPLSPVRMKLKVIIVQCAGNSQRDEWRWHRFNIALLCDALTLSFWQHYRFRH